MKLLTALGKAATEIPPNDVPKERPADIIEAISSKQYFGKAFKDLETWKNWTAFLKGIYGLPLDAEELGVFQSCTKRTAPPSAGFKVYWVTVGPIFTSDIST